VIKTDLTCTLILQQADTILQSAQSGDRTGAGETGGERESDGDGEREDGGEEGQGMGMGEGEGDEVRASGRQGWVLSDSLVS
jgi:hypothetical protein